MAHDLNSALHAQLERLAYRIILADTLRSAAAAGIDVTSIVAAAIDDAGLSGVVRINGQHAVGCDRRHARGAVGSAVG